MVSTVSSPAKWTGMYAVPSLHCLSVELHEHCLGLSDITTVYFRDVSQQVGSKLLCQLLLYPHCWIFPLFVLNGGDLQPRCFAVQCCVPVSSPVTILHARSLLHVLRWNITLELVWQPCQCSVVGLQLPPPGMHHRCLPDKGSHVHVLNDQRIGLIWWVHLSWVCPMKTGRGTWGMLPRSHCIIQLVIRNVSEARPARCPWLAVRHQSLLCRVHNMEFSQRPAVTYLA